MIPNSIYISGPMTGCDDLNFPAFNAAAEDLRAQGFTVINPADHGVIEGAEWADYLRADLAQLSQCAAIYMLPGWTESKGARLEHHVATGLGMRVFFAKGAERQAVQPFKANCYSDNDGDSWRDYPDDCDFVEGLKVGDTFELQASVRSWSETFRVTKVPDDGNDEYEVELVSSDAPFATHPTQQGLDAPTLDDALKVRLLDGGLLVRDKYGCGYHPALPTFDEGVNGKHFFAVFGIELKVCMAEDEMDSDAYEAMIENGLTEDAPNHNAWTPEKPEGDGWCLIAVFDTEDGPACWWVRAAQAKQGGV